MMENRASGKTQSSFGRIRRGAINSLSSKIGAEEFKRTSCPACSAFSGQLRRSRSGSEIPIATSRRMVGKAQQHLFESQEWLLHELVCCSVWLRTLVELYAEPARM